jgi:CubicO group peptidase (beta-lactamase class C family)
VRAIVEEERALAGTPAMSVAVMAEGRTAVLVASGMADLEAAVPATTETLFQAASVTKTLTAALVMREVERGRLSLDAPVNEHLPRERQVRDASGKPVGVTLRQLLSHSSGLPVSWSGIQRDPDEEPRTLDSQLAHGLVTMRAPGEKLIYSNDGFALAGWLAAQAEGTSYEALAQRAIFDPLGMRHSSFAPPAAAGPALAAAYGGLMGAKGRVSHQTASAVAPAGALLTTASDLARFGLACLGRGEIDGVRVLDASSVEQMMRLRARAHPRLPEGFGLGFGVREVPGRKLVFWDGGLAGAASRLALLPEHGVGVAVLSNLADNAPVTRAGNRILELLVPSQPTRSDVDVAAIRTLAGTYRMVDMVDPRFWFLEWLSNLRLQPDDGGLGLSSPLPGPPGRLVPVGPDLFRVEGTRLDGAFARFEGDRLLLAFLEARRIPFWQSARAIYAYAGAVGLALLALLVLGAVRLARRRRLRRRLA